MGEGWGVARGSAVTSLNEQPRGKGVQMSNRGLMREKEREKEEAPDANKAACFEEWDRKWGWREGKTEGAAA